MLRIKYLPIFLLLVLFSQQSIYAQTTTKKQNSKTISNATLPKISKPDLKLKLSVWPIVYGGGNFFFNQLGLAEHWPGYAASGGLTVVLRESSELFLFTDILYSYRAYDGFPENVHYRIEESTADIALGVGFSSIYIGAYAQLPLKTTVKVDEWTQNDFAGLSRNPSFSLMAGLRFMGNNVGFDVRVLAGQGPGQFLKSSFGEYWLGQISIGLMFGF